MDLFPTFAASLGDNYTSTTGYTDEDGQIITDELFHGYERGLLLFASICCIIFILVGIPGNLITIIALARCKKVRNATAVFIINLSLSDLLFCCFNLPLAASTFWHRSWIHSNLLCRLFPLLRYALLAVSLFNVLAITINRYVMITHPRIYPRIYRRKYLGVMVAVCWMSAFAALIPTWMGKWGKFGLDRTIGSCSILKDKNGNSPKEFLFLMAFALPCLFIVICYARIFYIVRRTALRSQKPMTAAPSIRNIPDNPMNGSSANISQKQRTNSQSESGQETSEEISDGLAKRRGLLSRIKEDDLKFIDTSVDSDSNNYLIRNMTSDSSNAKEVGDSILKTEDKVKMASSLSINKTVEFDHLPDSKDQLLDQSAESEETHSKDRDQQKNFDSSLINGSQFLAVLVEPSSSSGIDVAMDDEDKPPTEITNRKLLSSLKKSFKKMRSQDKNNNQGRKFSTVNNNTSAASAMYPGKMTTKDRRLLKMILVIFVAFLICYLPITITKIFQSVTNVHFLNIMSYLLIYLTTCINPIIYVVMSSEYRQAYWNLLLCRVNAWNRKEERAHRGSIRT